MVHQTPQPDQQPGFVSGLVRLDLTASTQSRRQRSQAWDLQQLQTGTSAHVHVGELTSFETDYDLVWLFTEAVRKGVSLQFEGSPAAVADWVDLVRAMAALPGRPKPRNLRLLRPVEVPT